MKSIKLAAMLIITFLIIFTRFWNLTATTRFTRDESQNLVDMHRIFVNRELTLIGPIDGTATIIYPSLTFYLLIPFAALGNFYPESPAYGTALFGVLAVGVMLWLVKKINPKLLGLAAILAVVWFPFLESSRWAWNPHLVPFFSFLALAFYLRKTPFSKFAAGILFGLSFHLHYLTVISFAVFAGLDFLVNVKHKKYASAIAMSLGFSVLILPFVYFDIKNPPGLFFNYFVKNNMASEGAGSELAIFPQSFLANIFNSLMYFTQNKLFALILGLVTFVFAISDLRANTRLFIFLIPVVFQIAVISFLPAFGNRYVLLGLPYFVIWLFYKRKKAVWVNWQKVSIALMAVGSLFSLGKVLTQPPAPPGAKVVSEVIDFIKLEVSENNLKNVNVATIASVDNDPLATIYRHTALVKDINLLSKDQYEITDNLFVVSTSDLEIVRSDPSNILSRFRDGEVVEEYILPGSYWKVYLFNRG